MTNALLDPDINNNADIHIIYLYNLKKISKIVNNKNLLRRVL